MKIFKPTPVSMALAGLLLSMQGIALAQQTAPEAEAPKAKAKAQALEAVVVTGLRASAERSLLLAVRGLLNSRLARGDASWAPFVLLIAVVALSARSVFSCFDPLAGFAALALLFATGVARADAPAPGRYRLPSPSRRRWRAAGSATRRCSPGSRSTTRPSA